MAFFDKIRGIFKLKKAPVLVEMRAGDAKAISVSGEKYEPKRVSPKDLETIYMREGMVYSWVNKFSEAVLSANYRVETSNTREQQIMDAFLKACNFRELLRNTIRNELIYGNAFWEIISDGKIKKVALLDTKMMDFLRDSLGGIIMEIDGKPKAYVQYVPWNVDLRNVPEDRRVSQTPKFPDYQSGKGILMQRDEVVHFVFNRVGSSHWGVGIIEPIYNLILVKQNAEQGFAEAIQRIAYPRLWIKVGDSTHPPTVEAIDHVREQLSNLETKDQFVAPYYYEPIVLEAKKTEKMTLNLQYFIDQIVAGLGGPKPFITGTGEKMNRATLGDMKLLFERSLKEVQEELSSKIENEVFARIAKDYKFNSIPKLIWEEISVESIDSKAERLASYVKAGLLTPDPEIERIIRRIEKLPEKEES